MRCGAEIFQTLKKLLDKRGLSTRQSVTKAASPPSLRATKRPLKVILEAIEAAGYTPGEQVAIGLDVRQSEFFKDG